MASHSICYKLLASNPTGCWKEVCICWHLEIGWLKQRQLASWYCSLAVLWFVLCSFFMNHNLALLRDLGTDQKCVKIKNCKSPWQEWKAKCPCYHYVAESIFQDAWDCPDGGRGRAGKFSGNPGHYISHRITAPGAEPTPDQMAAFEYLFKNSFCSPFHDFCTQSACLS